MFETNETLEAALLRHVRDVLVQDIDRGYWAVQLVPADRRVTAKQAAVICGRSWSDASISSGNLTNDVRAVDLSLRIHA